MFFRIFVISLSALLSFSAYADEIGVGGKVTVILNFEGHSGNLIKIEGMNVSAGFCPRNDYYILSLEHPLYQQNYSMLLAARMADKVISISVRRDNCLERFPNITHISM